VDIEPEYLELVSADTLVPVSRVEGDVLALVAARVGAIRLIDNHTLSTADRSPGGPVAAGSMTTNGRS
jgi:pantoate--beta-alanine ligase